MNEAAEKAVEKAAFGNDGEGLIFVVGPLRSGSTLLRLILDHHSALNMFGEFEAAVCFARGNAWPSETAYREHLATHRQTLAYNLTLTTQAGYREQVFDMLRQLDRRSSKPRMGASIHSRIDLLPRLFPAATYIHLYRDPRDVAKSCIGMGWVGNTYEGSQYWIDVEQRRKHLIAGAPNARHFHIHYEELVTEPENHMQALCEFLGVTYEANMLEIGHDTTYSYPSAAFANQWQSRLRPEEIRWVEARCGALMRTQGYETTIAPAAKVGTIERGYLRLQSRLARARFSIKKWGVTLWTQHVLANLLGHKTWQASVRLKTNAKDTLLLK